MVFNLRHLRNLRLSFCFWLVEVREDHINTYVRCINNKGFIYDQAGSLFDETAPDLVVGRVYKVALPEANDAPYDLRIIDESGEDYLFPASYFEPLKLGSNGHVTKTITAHVPDWLYGVLYAEALAANKSVSTLAREWLTEYLDLPPSPHTVQPST